MKSPGRKTAALGNVITTLVSLSLAILDSACAQVNPADAPKMHLNLVNQMQNQLDAQIMRISQNPSNHDAYLQAAEIHHLLGNLEDAVALYQEVIGLGHDSSKPWYRMGLIFIEQGDLAKAEKMLTKSLLLTPNEQVGFPGQHDPNRRALVDMRRLAYPDRRSRPTRRARRCGSCARATSGRGRAETSSTTGG